MDTMPPEKELLTAIANEISEWSLWSNVPNNKMTSVKDADRILINIIHSASDIESAPELCTACARALWHCLQPENDGLVRELLQNHALSPKAQEELISTLSVRANNSAFILEFLPSLLPRLDRDSWIVTWYDLIISRKPPSDWSDDDIENLIETFQDHAAHLLPAIERQRNQGHARSNTKPRPRDKKKS